MSAIAFEHAVTWGGPALFVLVFLSCLLLPIPASLLILFTGALVAGGAMPVWVAFVAPWAGVVLGDQAGYWAGRSAAEPVQRLLARRGAASLVAVARARLRENAGATLFFSRWLITPIAPYVTVLAGAAGVGWVALTAHSLGGRAIWVMGYLTMGWLFADRLEAAGATVGQTVMAITLLAIGLAMLRIALGLWRHHRATGAARRQDTKAPKGG
jgi:membrane-associated protein